MPWDMFGRRVTSEENVLEMRRMRATCARIVAYGPGSHQRDGLYTPEVAQARATLEQIRQEAKERPYDQVRELQIRKLELEIEALEAAKKEREAGSR